MDTPTLSLLRPTLELAISVARAGEREEPLVPAPQALQKYLTFARLPRPALEATKRVLDGEDAFRVRVAAATSEYEIGRGPWLFLTRPDGWEVDFKDELERDGEDPLAADRRAREVASRERSEREARARLEQRFTQSESRLGEARERLVELRRRNEEHVRETRRLELALESLRSERDELLARAKEAESKLTQRGIELRSARAQAAEAERARLDAEQAATSLADAAARAERANAAPMTTRPQTGPSQQDLAEAARGVAAAAAAAVALAGALDGVASALAPAVPDVCESDHGSSPGARAPGRRAPALPMGVVDDTPAAAKHLTSLSHVRVLVDGYNVSKTGWPTLELAMQRQRLVHCLCDLSNRRKAKIDIVFDGADDETRRLTASLPRLVSVAFTQAGVEADDHILALVEKGAAGGPIVVVSSDNRVRDGSRERGAAVLSSAALLTQFD